MTNHLLTHLMRMSAGDLDRTAFLWAGGSLSFAQLRHSMLRIAGWLNRVAGVAPGDMVACCLPKSPEAVLLMYGILAAGACYVPLHFLGPSDQMCATSPTIR